jgi:hypothetical protein
MIHCQKLIDANMQSAEMGDDTAGRRRGGTRLLVTILG